MKELIHQLFKRPVIIHPAMAKATGSHTLALLWSQIYYWSDKGSDPDGWIYKTRDDIYDETGLQRREQENARKIGEKLGVLESERKGVSGVMHYRVNMEKMIELCEAWAKKNPAKQPIFTAKKKELKPEIEVAIGTPAWIDQKAWDEWEQHRKEKRQALTPLSRKKQWAMLEQNKADHTAIINQSIQNGWTGLFPLKKFGKQVSVLQPAPGKYAKFVK